MAFPKGFLWGVAAAAYQIEGAHAAHGRKPSVWDAFSRQPGKVFDNHHGETACDHYHRYPEDVALIADLGAHALRAGRLAGKELSAAVRIADLAIDKAPAALEGHSVSVRLQFKDPESVAEHVRALSKGGAYSLSRLGKLIQPSAKGVSGAIIVRPNHPGFGEVVKTLDEAGFKHIEIDLDGAYAANPGLNPAEMLAGLGASAVYYAQCLSKGKYFRLDPIAALFYHIYEGKPRRRIDPAGLNELAIAEDGGIYPSWRMIGNEEFRVGSISEGAVDESVLNRFQDIGSVTTSVCRRCWARNLCGGGCAAVHQALSGSFRTPHGPWCEAQRVWMTAAVSAFNMLSSQGVNFTRIYQTFAGAQGGGKLSLATMMRAAFRMAIRMRPIEEHDAELLMRWENWTEAAYFLFNESGIFLATQYDREMDSLHPQGLDQEMILTKRDGAEFGLIRIRPDRAPGTAQAWIYMRDEKDYASGDVRKGIQFLLGKRANSSPSGASPCPRHLGRRGCRISAGGRVQPRRHVARGALPPRKVPRRERLWIDYRGRFVEPRQALREGIGAVEAGRDGVGARRVDVAELAAFLHERHAIRELLGLFKAGCDRHVALRVDVSPQAVHLHGERPSAKAPLRLKRGDMIISPVLSMKPQRPSIFT